jgi:hypothetical protein
MDGYTRMGCFETWLFSHAVIINLLVLLVIYVFALAVLFKAWRRWKSRLVFLPVAYYALLLFAVFLGLFRETTSIIDPACGNGHIRESVVNLGVPLPDILLALGIYLIYRRLAGIGSKAGTDAPPPATEERDGR